MAIVVRKARAEDREKVLEAERQATRNLQYLPVVYEEFLNDDEGEFSVAELDGEVVACGKFTVCPDNSAWLETLRVLPEYQGRGIGKRFYERFFELARPKGVKVMRMYTGLKNVVSKGLAERFGFVLAGTYRGMLRAPDANLASAPEFTLVTSPKRATSLIMPYASKWAGFLVMNRTFYAISPALCEAFAKEGKVYEHAASGSVIVLGARFMPEHGLHIGLFGGDVGACLDFANQKALSLGVPKIVCMFPPSESDIQDLLAHRGYGLEDSDFIVMEVTVE